MSAKLILPVPASGHPTEGHSRCRRTKRPYSPRNSRAEAAQALLLRLPSRERQLYIRSNPTSSWMSAKGALSQHLREGVGR